MDHNRTTRKHAGRAMKDTAAIPAFVAIGLGVAGVFAALFAFATRHASAGTVFAVAAAILMIGGLGWLERERRRVRRVEAQYLAQHPEADIQPPAS